MPDFQSRRSCRIAISVPIRVFGTDYRGIVFTEDSVTVVVNQHGAKIRMTHQLIPDQEIHLYSHSTYQDAPFRVVAKIRNMKTEYTYWGVECLDPEKDLWGVPLPALEPSDQLSVRVVLECPTCTTQVGLKFDERLLAMLEEEGGIPRSCRVCETSGRWKVMPFHQV